MGWAHLRTCRRSRPRLQACRVGRRRSSSGCPRARASRSARMAVPEARAVPEVLGEPGPPGEPEAAEAGEEVVGEEAAAEADCRRSCRRCRPCRQRYRSRPCSSRPYRSRPCPRRRRDRAPGSWSCRRCHLRPGCSCHRCRPSLLSRPSYLCPYRDWCPSAVESCPGAGSLAPEKDQRSQASPYRVSVRGASAAEERSSRV